MGRQKLPGDKRARLRSFERRKKGLKNAASDLSTLCGVDIGMIICNCESNELEVWPNRASLARMIQLRQSSSDQDRRYRAYGLSNYIKKEREKVKKMREKKIGKDDCDGFSHDQLRQLGEMLNAKIGAVREKMSFMKAEAAGVLMHPSVLESRFVASNIGQQHQPWTYFDAHKNVASETMFWGNSSMQESVLFMPDTVQQQQYVAYDIYNNLPGFVEGSRIPYSETNSFLMKQSVQGTPTFMPDIIQQQQHAYYEVRNNTQHQNENMMMLMMNGDGASCSQGAYNFDESPYNYAYFSSDNCFQNGGMQTEIMKNAGMNGVEEQLMSYDMPNDETMLQELLSVSNFPEKQIVKGYSNIEGML